MENEARIPTMGGAELIDSKGNLHVVACAQIFCERVREGAKLPTYANGPHLDNGVDLYAAEEVIIYPGATVLVPLGWKIGVPLGYALLILPRSGLSLKTPLRVPNAPGLIDHGYRNEVCVIVQNTGTLTTLTIKKGDRVAQGILVNTPALAIEEVESIGGDDRGGGFGSTGDA